MNKSPDKISSAESSEEAEIKASRRLITMIFVVLSAALVGGGYLALQAKKQVDNKPVPADVSSDNDNTDPGKSDGGNDPKRNKTRFNKMITLLGMGILSGAQKRIDADTEEDKARAEINQVISTVGYAELTISFNADNFLTSLREENPELEDSWQTFSSDIKNVQNELLSNDILYDVDGRKNSICSLRDQMLNSYKAFEDKMIELGFDLQELEDDDPEFVYLGVYFDNFLKIINIHQHVLRLFMKDPYC